MITDEEFSENIYSSLSIFESDINDTIKLLNDQRVELINILNNTINDVFSTIQPTLKKNISNIYYQTQNNISNFLISKKLDSKFKFSIKSWIDSNLIHSEDDIINILKNDLITIYLQKIDSIFFEKSILMENIELQIYKQIVPTSYDKLVIIPDIIDDLYAIIKNIFNSKEEKFFRIINQCLIKNNFQINKINIIPLIQQIFDIEQSIDSKIDLIIEGNRDLDIDQEFVIPNLLIDIRKIIFSAEFTTQDIIALIENYKIKYGLSSNILQYLNNSDNLNSFIINLTNLLDEIRTKIEVVLIDSELEPLSDQITNIIYLQFEKTFLSNIDLTINFVIDLLKDKKTYKFNNANSQILKLNRNQITEIIFSSFTDNSIEYIFKTQTFKDIQKLYNIPFKYQTEEDQNKTKLIILEFLSNIKNRRFNIIKNFNLTTLFSDFKIKLSNRYKLLVQSQIEKIMLIIEDLIISSKYSNENIDTDIIIKNSRLDPVYIKSLIST